MERIIFWNNKGGIGKTSLAFQTICEYALQNPNKNILVLDTCPQTNLSELLLGGLTQSGNQNLLRCQEKILRTTIGGYFQLRLSSPYILPIFHSEDFLTKPNSYNGYIPNNIDLLCGDALLELQSNAISTLANNQIPGTNTWIAIINWLNDFINQLENTYDIVFLDANPSFSIYTQIALATSTKIIFPITADDSSRRAIQNAFTLIYGLKLPSEMYNGYIFAQRLKRATIPLPKVYLIIRNKIIRHIDFNSAYFAIFKTIDQFIEPLLISNSDIFNFTSINSGFINIYDFQTIISISHIQGCPFSLLKSNNIYLKKYIHIKEEDLSNCIKDIQQIVNCLNRDIV